MTTTYFPSASRRAFLGAILCAPWLPLHAQFKRVPGATEPATPEPATPAPAADATFRTEVQVVNVLATVRDAEGKIVQGLSREDFELLENGVPREIQYFSSQSDAALSLGLLVDTSFSQRAVLSEQRDASLRFLEDMLRPEQDQAFVIAFDNEVTLLQGLTSGKQQLRQAVSALKAKDLNLPRRRMPIVEPQLSQWQAGRRTGPGRGRVPGGGRGRGGQQRRGTGQTSGFGTALFDAVYLAGHEVLTPVTGRKAILVLSDGADYGSKIGESAAIEAAQRADSVVYGLLCRNTSATGAAGRDRGRAEAIANYGRKTLESISRQTGGSMFEVSAQRPLSAIFATMQEELRSQYSLGFAVGDEKSEGFRKLEVQMKNRSLTVRARDGYYPRSA